MLNYLEKKYRQIPHGYFKIILKNILGFIIHTFIFKYQKLVIDEISFLAYKFRLYDNQQILDNEIKGYIKHYKLKKGDTVVDGGAYNGMFTLYASKKIGPKGKVIAFEPDPFNSKLLAKNIHLNKLRNVILIKKGLYNKEGKLRFNIQGMGSNIVPDGTDFVTLNSIQVTTLDNELKRLHIKKVDFVKMDIEGAEIEAVQGAKEIIKNNPKIHFAIASYHIVKGRQTHYFLMNFFKKLDMNPFRDYLTHPTTYASKKS